MRYCLIQDNDCHWAYIPFDRLKDWWQFLESDSYSMADYPDWCVLLGGDTSLLSFTDPKLTMRRK